jgi:uncharacterized protein YggE
VLVVLVVLGTVLTAVASWRVPGQVAAQQTAASERLISVTGEGRVSLTPDIATLTLGVEVFDPDAAAAQRAVAERMTSVLAVFRRAGVPENQIATVVYSITVERDWQQPSAPVTGYRVTHLVEVKLQPVERVGEVLTQAVRAGANVVQGVSFSVANPAAALRQARELAVRDARDRAAQLAQLSGVGLGEPVRIAEFFVTPPPVPVKIDAAADAPVPVGETTVVVSVSIDYAIR